MTEPYELNENEIELDPSDEKIIRLYEVIGEMTEELNARTFDLYRLTTGEYDIMDDIARRHDVLVVQIRKQLDIDRKQRGLNESDSDSDSSDSDDEDGESMEIIQQVEDNVNHYMEQFQDVLAAFEERDQEQSPIQQELNELELVLEQQTNALDQQTARARELEMALSSVLEEYSSKIQSSNHEISELSVQLSASHQRHEEQMTELTEMYTQEVALIKATHIEETRELSREAIQLRDSLREYREQFDGEMTRLTIDMTTAQRSHRLELQTWSNRIVTLQTKLKDRTDQIITMEREYAKKFNRLRKKMGDLKNSSKLMVGSLQLVRTQPIVYEIRTHQTPAPYRGTSQARNPEYQQATRYD